MDALCISLYPVSMLTLTECLEPAQIRDVPTFVQHKYMINSFVTDETKIPPNTAHYVYVHKMNTEE